MGQAAEYAGLTQEDDGLDELLAAEPSPEAERDGDFADKYVNGVEPTQPGDPHYQEFQTWLAGLPAERRRELDETKADYQSQTEADVAEDAAAREVLLASAPELLQGRLPAELASRLEGSYALGINQSDAAGTPDEAAAYIAEQGGLPLLGYNPDQRFMFIDADSAAEDPNYAEQALLRGYYGTPEIGRLVVAFPVVQSEAGETPADVAAQPVAKLPDDFYVETSGPKPGQSDHAVNTKYLAGFIDGDGRFYPNRNFAQSGQLDLAAGE